MANLSKIIIQVLVNLMLIIYDRIKKIKLSVQELMFWTIILILMTLFIGILLLTYFQLYEVKLI